MQAIVAGGCKTGLGERVLSTSPQLQRLADALRPALGLPPSARAVAPDLALARFASQRHRIGPLLHRAWSMAGGENAEVSAFLERISAENAQRELRQKAATRKFGALLETSEIGWAEFKGWRLGEELYGESALRQSKDVDLLLPADRVEEALGLASAEGYRIGGKSGDFGLRKARWMLRHHREIGVVDPEMQVQIEVHSRLLGYPPPGWRDPVAAEGGGAVSINDPEYVLYLIVHGALTGWKRLKWLCDLVMIAQVVTPDIRKAAIARSRELGCEAALVASLLAVAELWGEEIVAPWLFETRTSADDEDVRGHLAVIARRLGNDERPRFSERAMRHAGIIRDPAVFGRHPAPLRGFRDRVALWLLAKL